MSSSTPDIIHIHPLTSNPTDAWDRLKLTNRVENVTPMTLGTPIPPDKVRFVCLSDTHTLTSKITLPIPEGDVFMHAGDFTRRGLMNEIKDFNEFL